MTRAFLTTLATAFFIGHACAADLHSPATATNKSIAPQTSWTGLYAGLSLGWAKNAIQGSTLKADGTVGFSASEEAANEAIRGAMGGLYLGAHKQIASNFVLGVEGDFSVLGGRESHVARVIAANTWQGEKQAELSYRAPWLATGRLKAGVLVLDHVMVYATGGLAFSAEHEKRVQYVGNQATSLSEVAFTEADRKTRFGWALGGGVEWRLTQNWSVRAEYLHADFARQTFQFPNARGGVVPTAGYLSVQGRLADNRSRIDLGRIGMS